MTIRLARLTTTVALAGAVALAACGDAARGVEASRSDRSPPNTAEPAPQPNSTDTPSVETTTTSLPPVPTTQPTTTQPPATTTTTTTIERPPAPAASGPGSVSADDLATAFLPTNPNLLGPSSDLTDGRDPATFIDEALTFTGMDPVVEIAGAPLTLASYTLVGPTYDDNDVLTSATGFRARHRMALEVPESDHSIDVFAEALRDELRPVVEGANPGQPVIDTHSEAPLGNSIFGLAVGPEHTPTTTVEIQQHYVIVPRPVNEPLLSVSVTRVVSGDAIALDELPSRDRFVDADLQTQIDLFGAVPAPVSPPRIVAQRLLLNIPSAGSARSIQAVEYEVDLPEDGFEDYGDRVADIVEADQYAEAENLGGRRSFVHLDAHTESEFVVERTSPVAALVRVQGDVTAYPR